jgi:hypothetical protein
MSTGIITLHSVWINIGQFVGTALIDPIPIIMPTDVLEKIERAIECIDPLKSDGTGCYQIS